jgi:hypothetical protein
MEGVGLKWETLSPTDDTWTCCVGKTADDVKFVVQCGTFKPRCCHTERAAFGFDEEMGLIQTVLYGYRYLRGHWRKHVGQWLAGWLPSAGS